jgi:hypothetical protein
VQKHILRHIAGEFAPDLTLYIADQIAALTAKQAVERVPCISPTILL